MNEGEWKLFLEDYNRELLAYEEVLERLPKNIIASGSLGFAGASEEEIAAAEARLVARLPASYRSFLRVSNGWQWPSAGIPALVPAGKLAWFKENNQDWIDAYTEPAANLPAIPDAEYLNYGDTQDCCKIRTEYLQTALEISKVGNSAIVLLNPKVVTPEGEWETWYFDNTLPGAIRYRSFGDWLKAERETYLKICTTLPAAKARKYLTAKKPVSTKKAQAAAREAKTDLALESLEEFAQKGDDAAAASLAELYAFLGQWEKVIPNAGRLLANPGAVYAGNVFSDLIRLIGVAGRRTGHWNRVIEAVTIAAKANQERVHDQGHKWVQDRATKLFDNLLAYANRNGAPPHELLYIFGKTPDTFFDIPKEEAEANYRDAVAKVDSLRPDLKNKPKAKAAHFFSLAKNNGLENEALRIYEANKASFTLDWAAAEYIGLIHAKLGNHSASWAALKPNLAKWWPVDFAQVAPVSLLIDEHLINVMTPERCELLLATPRGPEGVKKPE